MQSFKIFATITHTGKYFKENIISMLEQALTSNAAKTTCIIGPHFLNKHFNMTTCFYLIKLCYRASVSFT